MKLIRLGVPAMIVGAGLMLLMTPSFGTPAYAKKEKKGCVTCHVSAKVTAKDKNLNDTGKCYLEAKDLAKCKK
jgi:hypothetical protein